LTEDQFFINSNIFVNYYRQVMSENSKVTEALSREGIEPESVAYQRGILDRLLNEPTYLSYAEKRGVSRDFIENGRTQFDNAFARLIDVKDASRFVQDIRQANNEFDTIMKPLE
jgi:hypothetical protein